MSARKRKSNTNTINHLLTVASRAANATVQCPVEEGDYVVSHTVALPREIPPG